MMDTCSVLEAANELATVGGKRPSIKLALWTAELSAQKGLDLNGKQARVLATFVERGLPADAEETYRAFADAGVTFITRAQVAGLYYVEMLDRYGCLLPFEHRPELGNRSAWLEWREDLYGVLHGHCFSRKTISMASLILWPVETLLVPVDTHHVARLGYDRKAYECSSRSKQLYLEIEDRIYAEWLASDDWAPFSVWAWFKWEERRRQVKASKATGDRPESHAALSCRWY